MSSVTVGLFLLGLLLLVGGAELLVRGASRLAASIGISPLVVGLTVVAFGTSAPELAVSLQSAWSGQADLAMGNVVGSNIANVLLILGLSATIAPLLVASQLIRIDVPLMIGASVLLYLLAFDGQLAWWDGALLFAGIIVYTVWLIRQSRREGKAIQAEFSAEFGAPLTPGRFAWLTNLALIIAGLILLVFGARWLVDSAVTFARWFGVSELIIGLTVVAVGTSLPELATSLLAALRGERDIAVGNVIGSNIFNLLSVLGLASLISPQGVTVSTAVQAFDLPIMIAVAIACLPIFYTGHQIARWEGLLFLGYYAVYVAYLVMAATQHDSLPRLNSAMLFFVLPLTALGLMISFIHERQARRQVISL